MSGGQLFRICRVMAVVAIAGVLTMCGDDEVGHDSHLVGAPCGNNADCDDRCVEGGNFPNGTCTVDCAHDEDCPVGTHCIDTAGGVCLISCDSDHDCRGGYDCRSRKREGHPGHAPVCFGD